MHYPHIKTKAQKMRRNGKSFGEISSKLQISKSTLSFWFKDIILNQKTIKKIKTRGSIKSTRALLQYAELSRRERMNRNTSQKKEGASIVENLSSRDRLMIGFGLYWGEGYKYENGELGFTNSNPYMIRFYIKWLKLWDVKKDMLIFKLTINEFFKHEEKYIKNFWINFLRIKKEQFSKTTLINTKLKKASKENLKNYKGVFRVKVRRGRDLRNKILGAIEQLQQT